MSLLDDVVLYDDRPLEDERRHVVDFGPLLKLAANTVTKSDGPMVVAVTGGWGSGKTTFCRALCDRLRPEGVAAYVLHATDCGDDAERLLLFAIAMAVTGEDAVEATEITRRLLPTRAARRDLAAQADPRQFDAWLRGRLSDPPAAETGDAGRRAPHGPRAVLLVVDDLDRCTGVTAMGLLEALRRYLSCRRLFILLAADRKVLLDALKESRNEVPGLGAHRALEKYIRLEIELPLLGVVRPGDRHPQREEWVRRLRLPAPGPEPSPATTSPSSALDFPSKLAVQLGDEQDYVTSLEELLVASFTQGLTIRTFKRIMNDVMVSLGRDGDRYGVTPETLTTWRENEYLSDWFNGTRVFDALDETAEARVAGAEPQRALLVAWNALQLHTLVRMTCRHVWPVLSCLLEEDRHAFQRAFAVMAATASSGGVFDLPDRRVLIETALAGQGVQLPEPPLLEGLCRLAHNINALTRRRGARAAQEPRPPSDGPPPPPGPPSAAADILSLPRDEKSSAPVRPPTFISPAAADLWRRLAAARNLKSPDLMEVRTLFGAIEYQIDALPREDLDQLFGQLHAFVEAHLSPEIAVSAGNLAVDFETRQLDAYAYALYRLVREKGMMELDADDPAAGFRLASQYVSFLQDNPDYEIGPDPGLKGRTPQEEIQHYIEMYRPVRERLAPELQRRFDRLAFIASGGQELGRLEEMVAALPEPPPLDGILSIFTLMNRFDRYDRGLIERLVQRAQPGDRDVVRRGAADLLAASPSVDDERTAVWLYGELRNTTLWRPDTKHNLAVLLARHRRCMPTAFRLWAESLRERPDDRKLRIPFAQFLDRLGQTSAARTVLLEGKLPPGLRPFEEEGTPPWEDPYYTEMGLEAK